MPLSRDAAAASGLTPSGTYATKSAGATQYSAYAPLACAVTTRSPTLSAATSSPTASTVPQTSVPRTNGTSRGYCPDRK